MHVLQPPRPTPSATAADPGYQLIRQAADIARLEAKHSQLDELCRGGSGQDPRTLQACTYREDTAAELKKLGYCYYQPAADAVRSDYPSEGWTLCSELQRLGLLQG